MELAAVLWGRTMVAFNDNGQGGNGGLWSLLLKWYELSWVTVFMCRELGFWLFGGFSSSWQDLCSHIDVISAHKYQIYTPMGYFYKHLAIKPWAGNIGRFDLCVRKRNVCVQMCVGIDLSAFGNLILNFKIISINMLIQMRKASFFSFIET